MITGAVERRVVSGGVELAVIEAGDPSAPTVLLVHGYPDTKEVWRRVASRLVDRFHVAAYDVRGAGASGAPRDLAGYDLARLVDDAKAVLDAVSPDEPAHLVGHDCGSVQGWEMATSPVLEGRLASFTSISGPSLDHIGHWLRDRVRHPRPRSIATLAGQGARSLYVGAFQVPGFPDLLWRGPLARRWPEILARREHLPADSGYPMPSLAADGARGANFYRQNVPRRLRHPRDDAFATVPVQLIVPTGEPFLSPRLYDDLDRWVPTLRRRAIVTRHWVPLSRPDELAGWIGEFVDDVLAGTPLGAHANRPADDERPFAGKLVLITGAGSGIGRATAFSFAEAGAEVIAVDVDGHAAARTAELAALLGARAHPVTADVTDESAMDALAKTVAAERGTVDVLVNNAGIGVHGSFLDTSTDDWRRTLDVNLYGVIHGCRLFARQMVERGEGGHIVNLASAAAFQPSKVLSAYSTSKAAVLMLSECLRAELAGHDIGVTAVCPGIVATSITRTTRFVGRSSSEQSHLRESTSRLYRRRNFPPERVAEEILRSVIENRSVVAVTPEAKATRALARFAPAVLRRLARVDALAG